MERTQTPHLYDFLDAAKGAVIEHFLRLGANKLVKIVHGKCLMDTVSSPFSLVLVFLKHELISLLFILIINHESNQLFMNVSRIQIRDR